ncbi:hypothetical protein [Candidatus Poriferisodalis sp.]|uniref:hypothetical protein n=1 Tax=Candidatus Poriferisodalis sp. TaxID=3101277 RepID=UPI003B02347F
MKRVLALAAVVALFASCAVASDTEGGASWCDHFEEWRSYDAKHSGIERQYRDLPDVNDWPPGELSRWGAYLRRRNEAAEAMWAAAPASISTWADVRAACG